LKKLSKYLLILIFVSLASAIVLMSYRPYLGIDDAFIYFVYAKNLAHGHGFVYNVGGERVEGFTSMLWVLICSLFYRLFSENYFRQALVLLNIAMVSFALFRLIDFLDRRFAGRPVSFPSFPSFCLLAILFVVKGYLDWTVMSLLETGLWSTCLILITVHLLELCYDPPSQREALVFGPLLLVLVLTRPESLLLGVVFLVIRYLLLWRKNRSFISALKGSLLPMLFFAGTFSCLTFFRLRYFGYPYPNTYYAKVSSSYLYNFKQGFLYFREFVLTYPVYWIPMVMLVVSLWVCLRGLLSGRRTVFSFRDNELAQICIATISAIALLLPLTVGGDHFALFRIYQPFAPVILLLLFNGGFIQQNLFDWDIKRTHLALSRMLLPVFLLPVIYLMNQPKYFRESQEPFTSIQHEFYAPFLSRQTCGELNALFDLTPKPSIGRITAGGNAFYYEGATVDLMGLNSTLMAHADRWKIGIKNHASFNKDAFYKLRPDLVEGEFVDPEHFVLPANRSAYQFRLNVLKGIFKDAAFLHAYQPVLISHPGDAKAFFTYARMDYIDLLRRNNYRITFVQS